MWRALEPGGRGVRHLVTRVPTPHLHRHSSVECSAEQTAAGLLVLAVASLLATRHGLGQTVVVSEVLTLVMTGSVAEAGRNGGTAGRCHRLEIIELLPGDAVGVDHVQAELVGAVDLDTERLSVLLADAVGPAPVVPLLPHPPHRAVLQAAL